MNRYKLFVKIEGKVVSEIDTIYEANSPTEVIEMHDSFDKESFEWTVGELNYHNDNISILHGPYVWRVPDEPSERWIIKEEA